MGVQPRHRGGSHTRTAEARGPTLTPPPAQRPRRHGRACSRGQVRPGVLRGYPWAAHVHCTIRSQRGEGPPEAAAATGCTPSESPGLWPPRLGARSASSSGRTEPRLAGPPHHHHHHHRPPRGSSIPTPVSSPSHAAAALLGVAASVLRRASGQREGRQLLFLLLLHGRRHAGQRPWQDVDGFRCFITHRQGSARRVGS